MRKCNLITLIRAFNLARSVAYCVYGDPSNNPKLWDDIIAAGQFGNSMMTAAAASGQRPNANDFVRSVGDVITQLLDVNKCTTATALLDRTLIAYMAAIDDPEYRAQLDPYRREYIVWEPAGGKNNRTGLH